MASGTIPKNVRLVGTTQNGWIGWIGTNPIIRWQYDGHNYQLGINLTAGRLFLQTDEGGSWATTAIWDKTS